MEREPRIMALGQLYAPVAHDLEQVRQILADELISDQPLISDLCCHVGQFHGKMLRPALLLLSGRAFGELEPAHHTLGAVVELVHIATLVHDDVLDEADIRRRAATVNRLWGNERAVLLGDFLYTHAYHLCSSLDSQYAARLVGQTAITVCEGEMMQVAHRGNFELAEADYLDIVTRKTASLVETCCQLGAWAAGADVETTRQMRTFGRCLGIAFQIIDDLLDLVGDEAQVGKSLGRDLCEGELTLPLIHHLRLADAAQRERTLTLVNGNGARPNGDITKLMRKTGSVAYARDVAAQYVADARRALGDLPPTPALESLRGMADFVIARQH
jgi:octaprenyl-diphosphate synthase